MTSSDVGFQISVEPHSDAMVVKRSEIFVASFVASFVGNFVDKARDKAHDKGPAYSDRMGAHQ